MSGYCILDTHIKIGSKLHTDRFFYLKRLFQNSFYAVRMGFVISKLIDEVLKSKKNSDSIKKLTILSYGLYSELLVSNISKFLGKANDECVINHAIIYDTTNKHIASEGPIHNDIILVVPIASTLSTAAKIIELLTQSGNYRLITEPINVIVLGPDKIESMVDSKMKVINKPANTFWEKIDISAKFIYTKLPETKQRYFIYLASKWYLPLECPLCYPDELDAEKPLFHTDTVSVTPAMTFGLPKPKKNTNKYTKTLHLEGRSITASMLLNGHIKRSNNHYLHYIDTIAYHQHNYKNIVSWALTVRDALIEECLGIQHAKLFIIAPAHNTNSLFIDLINSTIFNDSALVFHYDHNEDEVNFSQYLEKNVGLDSHVFFVDDALCTGKTFNKISMLLSNSTGKRFDAAITLLNRLTRATDDSICGHLGGRLFAYLNVEEEAMIGETGCFICMDEVRCKNIFHTSIMDFMKMMWLRNLSDLRLNEILPSNVGLGENAGGNRAKGHNYKTGETYLKRLQIHDRVIRFFDDKSGPALKQQFPSFNDFIVGIFGNSVGYDDKVIVFEVLTCGNLINYQYVKESVLSWLLHEVETSRNELKSKLTSSIPALLPLDLRIYFDNMYGNYRYLKFLIKSLCKVKSNYMIRKEIMADVFSLHNEFKSFISRIDSYINRVQSKESSHKHSQRQLHFVDIGGLEKFKREIETFNLFFAKQIKSLVWDDEWKSVKLEITLNDLIADDALQAINSSYRSLIRILRIENVNPLNDLLEKIRLSKQLNHLPLQFDSKTYASDIGLIKTVLRDTGIFDTNRSLPVLALLGSHANMSLLNDSESEAELRLLPLILLKIFLYRKEEVHETSEESRNKIKYILYVLTKILGVGNGVNGSEGAFFILRYGAQMLNGIEQDEISITASLGITPPDDDYDWLSCVSYKILKGEQIENEHYPWTNYELVRCPTSEYLTSYSGKEFHKSAINEAQFFGNANHFLFIRISGNDENSHGNGVFVFCTRDKNFFDDRLLRYVLLLRRDIYNFIDLNYNNEVYRAWIYEEKNRKNMLSMGHDFKSEIDQMYRLVEGNIKNPDTIKKVKIHYKLIRNKLKYLEMLNDTESIEPLEYKPTLLDTYNLLYELKNLVGIIYEDSIEDAIYTDYDTKIFAEIDNIFFDKEVIIDLAYEVILNSKKHVDKKKTKPVISFRFYVENGEPYLSVCDNGCGVESWELDKLNSIGYLKSYGGLRMFSLLWKRLFGTAFTFSCISSETFGIAIPLGGGK